MASFTEEDPTMPVDLENSTNIGQLGDVTFGINAAQRRDMSLNLLDRMSSGRRSPVRAKTMKEYDQEMADLKKENFDLKLRIYFLEDRMKIHSRGDEFKLNIELNVQVESLKRDLMDKQELLRQATTALDGHLAQCEVQRERARAEGFGEGRALQAHLEGQLAERQKALETAEAALDAMRKQLETAVDVKLADALRREAADKEDELDRVRKERIDYEEQVVRPLQIAAHEMEEALHERDAAIERLTSELRSVTLLQSKSEGLQKEYELELDEQRQQIDEFKVIVDQFGKECTAKDQRLKTLEQQLLQKEQEAKDLKNSAGELSRQSKERQESAEARYQALLEESQRQATAKDRAIERLGRQLQDAEKQMQASSDLAERQHAAAAGQAAERRDSLIASLREKLQDKEKHVEALIEEKFKMLEEKDAQIQVLRLALRQKDHEAEEMKRQLAALSGEAEAKEKECRDRERTARELAASLKAAQRAAEAGDEGYKRSLDEKNNAIKKLEEAVKNRDHQISVLQAAAEERPTEAVVAELRRLLAFKDRQLCDAMSERGEAAAAGEQTAAELADKLRHRDSQMKMMTEKYAKEMRNLEEQLLQLQLELGRKSYELQAFSGHLRGSSDASTDILDHLRAALVEKDKTIAALVESSKEKDALLRRWQDSGGGVPGSPAQFTLLLPQTAVSSSPRPAGSAHDDSADHELQRLRTEVKYLRELLRQDGESGAISVASSPRSPATLSSRARAVRNNRVKPVRPAAFAGMLKDLLRAERELYESLKRALDSSSSGSEKEKSLEAALRDMAALRDRALASVEESERLRAALELRLQALERGPSAAGSGELGSAYATFGDGIQTASYSGQAAVSSCSSSSHTDQSATDDGLRPPAEPKTPSRRPPPPTDGGDLDDDFMEDVSSVSVADTRLLIANRLAKAKSNVRSLEDKLLTLSNEAVDGAVMPPERVQEQVVKRLESAQLENRQLQAKLTEAERRAQSLDGVAALLRRQLELNTQTPELPSGFNPDLIVSMAQEIERLKRRLGSTAKADAAAGSDADGTESESAPEEEMESLRRQLASSRNVISLLKRQIELNGIGGDGSAAMAFNPQLIVDMAAEIERLKEERRLRRQQHGGSSSSASAVPHSALLPSSDDRGGQLANGVHGSSEADSATAKAGAAVSRHKSGIPLPLRTAPAAARAAAAARVQQGSAAPSAVDGSGRSDEQQLEADSATQQLLEAQARARQLELKLAATEATVRQQSRKARFYRSLLEEAGLASAAAASDGHSRSASESNLPAAAATSSAAGDYVTEARAGRARRRSLGSRPRSGSAATLSSSLSSVAAADGRQYLTGGSLLDHQATSSGRAAPATRGSLPGDVLGGDGQQVAELRRQLERYASIIRTLEARIRFGSTASVGGSGADGEAAVLSAEELQDRLRRSEEARQALEEALLAGDRRAMTAWLPSELAASTATILPAAATGVIQPAPSTRDSGDGEGGTSMLRVPGAATMPPQADSPDGSRTIGSAEAAVDVKGVCSRVLDSLTFVSGELQEMLAQDENGDVPFADVTAERVTALKQKLGECIAHLRYVAVLMDEDACTEPAASGRQSSGGAAADEEALRQQALNEPAGSAQPRIASANSSRTGRPSAGRVSARGGGGSSAAGHSQQEQEEPWSELQELYRELERRAELLGSANQRVDELDCELQRLSDENRIKDELIKQLHERVADLELQLSSALSAAPSTSGGRSVATKPTHRLDSTRPSAPSSTERHKADGDRRGSVAADGNGGGGRRWAAAATNAATSERSASIADGSDEVVDGKPPSSSAAEAATAVATQRRARRRADAAEPVSSSGAEDGSMSAARSDPNVLSNRYLAAAAPNGDDGGSADSGSDAGSLLSEALSEDGNSLRSSRSATPASARAVPISSSKPATIEAQPPAGHVQLASYRSLGSSSGAPSEKERLRWASDSASSGGAGSAMAARRAGDQEPERQRLATVTTAWDLDDLITVGSASPLSSRRTSCSSGGGHQVPAVTGSGRSKPSAAGDSSAADIALPATRSLDRSSSSRSATADAQKDLHLDSSDVFADDGGEQQQQRSAPAHGSAASATRVNTAASPGKVVAAASAAGTPHHERAGSDRAAYLNRNSSAVDGLHRSAASTRTSDGAADGEHSLGSGSVTGMTASGAPPAARNGHRPAAAAEERQTANRNGTGRPQQTDAATAAEPKGTGRSSVGAGAGGTSQHVPTDAAPLGRGSYQPPALAGAPSGQRSSGADSEARTAPAAKAAQGRWAAAQQPADGRADGGTQTAPDVTAAASAAPAAARQKLALLSWESDDEHEYDYSDDGSGGGGLRSGDGQEEELSADSLAMAGGGVSSGGIRPAAGIDGRPWLADTDRRRRPDEAVLSLYEQELDHLQQQLEAASELNVTLREELQLHESLWRQQQQQKDLRPVPGSSGGVITGASVSSRSPLAPSAGHREDGQSLLNMQLDEIRALRQRLEAAITNNNQLREDLERKLAADESRSADLSNSHVHSQMSGAPTSITQRPRFVRHNQASALVRDGSKAENTKTAALLKAAMLSLRRKKDRLAALQTAEQDLRALLERSRESAAAQLEAERERAARVEANLRRALDEAAALRLRQQRLESELDRAREGAAALRSREQQLCDDLSRAVHDVGEGRRHESQLEAETAAAAGRAAKLEAELGRALDETATLRRREASLSAELGRAAKEAEQLREREQRTATDALEADAAAEHERSRADQLEQAAQLAAAESQSRERALADELQRTGDALRDAESRGKQLADELASAGADLEAAREREVRLSADARRLSRELAEGAERSRQLAAELKQAGDGLTAARAREKQLAFDAEQAREDAAAALARERCLDAELRRADDEATAAAERDRRLNDELALVHRSAELRLDGELRRLRAEAEAERVRLAAELAAARAALALAEERLAAALAVREQHDPAACERQVAELKQQALASAEDLLREVKARDEQLAEKDRRLSDRDQQRRSQELDWSKQKEELLGQVAHKDRSIKDLKNELNRALEELEIFRDRVAETEGVNETLKFELSVLETLRPVGGGGSTAAAAGAGLGASDSGPRLTVKDGSANLDLTSFFDEMRRLRVQLERSIEANNRLRQKLEESMVARRRRGAAAGKHESRLQPDAAAGDERDGAADGGHSADEDDADYHEPAKARERSGQRQRAGKAGVTDLSQPSASRSARRSLFPAAASPANGHARPADVPIDERLLTMGDLDAREPSSPMHRLHGRGGNGRTSAHDRYAVSDGDDDDGDELGVERSLDREGRGNGSAARRHAHHGSMPSLADRVLRSPGLQPPAYGYQYAGSNSGLSPRSQSATRIDSDVQTLFAVCRLNDYELLKRENEQCLVTLSAVEARIQDRLDAFAAATSPSSGGSTGQLHWSLEYSTLRELKHCVDELRGCLFEEKRLVTLFWITRLPGSLPGDRSSSPELYLARENKQMREELGQVKSKYRALQKMVGNLADTVEKSKSLKGADLANYVAQLTEINRVLGRAKRNLKQRVDD